MAGPTIGFIGTGVMEELWHGRVYTLPFLHLGTWRRFRQDLAVLFLNSLRRTPAPRRPAVV